jgi:hypothetical protein
MAQYAVSNQNGGTPQALTTTYKTSLAISAATGGTTLRRGWVYEFEIGAASVPNATDCPIQYDVSVQTAVGTATALTPQPIDIGGGDAAALLTYSGNHTVEPTITANSSVFNIGLNQRASQRWIARDQASSIIVPAVNAKGPVFRALSPNYTGTITVQAYVQE